MNKIFKVIWNPATGNYTVTSETAKSRGKKSGRSKLLISALVAGGMLSSFGALANAGNDNGQGVDYGSGSAGDGWVAIGKGAKANTFMNTSGSSTAVGYDAIAEGQYSSAIGSKTHAIGGASMAFGVSAISEGDRSIALGASSYSLGQYSMALGRYSKALGKLSIAMGDSSKAEGANAIALGNATKATEIMSIALGDTANASKAYSMALGASSVASEENAIALGRSSVASGTDSLAFGRQSLASAANAIAIGAETEAAENATAIGNNAKAKGTNSMAMGFGSLADKVNTIALGNGSQALADNAIAIGQGNKADGVDAIALGNGSQSRGLNTIALGTASNATGDKSLALGSNSSANGINSVALGADSIADLDNTVSVGNSSLKRKIVNVKNGAIKSDSYDAINGSQLYAISDSVAKRLGGGAAVDVDDGTVTAPTYNLKNGSKNNVGAALAVLDENTLQWDQTKGKYSAAHGTSSPTASVITDVADGTISASSKDAVNGSQLKATNDDVEANTANIATNTSNIATNTASIATNTTNITNLTDSVGDLQADALLWNETKKAFSAALSIGDDGKYRQIINVADGSEAHDAVTVRQLQNAIGAVATTPTKYFHANSTEEDSLAVGTDSLAMGAKTIVNGDKGIGIGYGAYVDANALNGIAIGSNAQVIHVNSIAIGNGSTTTRGAQTNYTAYNMDAPQNSVGEFSVGSADGQRQITNVAAGSADTDAVNVGQLKVTDAQVSQNTQSITNLNNQVTNLDTRVTNIENGIGDIVTSGSTKYFKTNTDGVDANAQGKDSVAIGSGSIAAADNSVALGTGSVAEEENTISVGSSTNQRRITNVAAGVNATDAVNVSQLKSSEAGGVRYDTKADGSIDYSNITLGGGNGSTTRISNVSAGVNNNDAVNYAQLKQSVQETKQYTDQRMVEMDNKLSKTESKLSGGIASAMAMTGLPQAYTPGASMASIGGGTYNGESAVALGVSMVSANGRWVYKLQGSTNSQGEYSAALGAGIQW
ncbi:YadA-like family protein [Escherichia coli]|uniref:YadA-like family protein n=1 Tax=Escherichia coli TaxID=562 RepID=UPI0029C29FB3|nr:YadA-like family protein [Escherichia coli]MDX5603341.1 YadA-like family protein [Escherichia coli]